MKGKNMRKTKKELLKFIESIDYNEITTRRYQLAERLIKEGWVVLEEPEEFWLVGHIICSSREEAERVLEDYKKDSVGYPSFNKAKIIHVKEVVGDGEDWWEEI